jgi:large subunit ribosomal protein L30
MATEKEKKVKAPKASEEKAPKKVAAKAAPKAKAETKLITAQPVKKIAASKPVLLEKKAKIAVAKKEKHGPFIKLQQVKSGAGRFKSQRLTLIALGLGKINKVVEIQDTPSARGMVEAVRHLVKVL